MNGHGQSDRSVVPANPPDKAAAAEAGEERERTKGNADSKTRPGHSAGSGVSSALDRVRQVAVRDKEARFTALLHHVTLERLVMAYWDLSPKAAPGVDGVGRSTLKWPHCSLLIWPHLEQCGARSSPLIWPHLRDRGVDLCDTPGWFQGAGSV